MIVCLRSVGGQDQGLECYSLMEEAFQMTVYDYD
jgi:hypothetical protein